MSSARARIERTFDPDAVRKLEAEADHVVPSPVRGDGSAYVLGVARTLHPELAEPPPAVRHNHVDHNHVGDLERRTS